MADTPDDIIKLALERYRRLARQGAFVPNDETAMPTAAQASFLDDVRHDRHRQYWIVSANRAGKSLTVFRTCAWLLEESLPGWKRPERWGKQPLLFIVMGRNGKQIEDSILPYITSALDPNEYKIVRIGNIVQRLEHVNGNRVVFQSMENAQTARERAQGYTAHAVFVDEMPPIVELITEGMTRLYTTDGYFFASFTPLAFNLDIKAMVDGAQEPLGKKYRFRMFDNPSITPDIQQRILAEMAHLSETERNARLYGDWVVPSSKVFNYTDEACMRELPPSYFHGWRHVRAVDPAISSKLGYVLAAEDPKTGFWYIVKALYKEGIKDPNALFDAVMKEDAGYNIIRRVCDPHETWFMGLSSAKGVTHVAPVDKANRRGEMVANLQKRLGSTLFLTPGCPELRQELLGAQWSETTEGKIANSSKYHQLDSTLYLVDCLPPVSPTTAPVAWWTEVRENDRKWRASQEEAKRVASLGKVRRRTRSGGQWRVS